MTGLFAIGGGMATIPFLQDISAKTGWFTIGQLADMIAIAESTPGALGVNMSTYVGYTTGYAAGGYVGAIFGAVIATLGLVCPSIIVITIIATILDKFRKSKYVKAAFYGLRPTSVGLIAAAAVSSVLIVFFGSEEIYDLTGGFSTDFRLLILAILLFVGTNYIPKLKKLHPIWFIAVSALIGIIFAL